MTNELSRDPEDTGVYQSQLIDEVRKTVRNTRVLSAMRRVPRHLFVPHASLSMAYLDIPLPIGFGQTISQPTVVAMMTDALELIGTERVLEIGTGSGYQAAVLSLLSLEVYTIELYPALADSARRRLAHLGYKNVKVLAGDGYKGSPEHAPFDRILLTAAPEQVPPSLVEQLREGGVLVAPVGRFTWEQQLMRYTKKQGHLDAEALGAVAFVPMVASG